MEISVVPLLIAWCFTWAAEGSRYDLYHKDARSWTDAMDRCVVNSRTFAHVKSSDDQRAVERLGSYSVSYFWIGLRLNETTQTFQWSDHNTVTWTNWGEGHPGTDVDSGCVRMRNDDFAWETHNCSAMLNYLCEDADYPLSLVVSSETKIKGVLLGLGVIGGLLSMCCLLLQCPCCRHGITQRIIHIGFGTKDLDDKKPIF